MLTAEGRHRCDGRVDWFYAVDLQTVHSIYYNWMDVTVRQHPIPIFGRYRFCLSAFQVLRPQIHHCAALSPQFLRCQPHILRRKNLDLRVKLRQSAV
ncbi:hypothetical protein ALO78_200181 [Pseudomonas amygdali pv. ciccaronei]|nr:hypothetical protein ALO78_200181 [Pseudomonas amygdali pv. ciccaronei]